MGRTRSYHMSSRIAHLSACFQERPTFQAERFLRSGCMCTGPRRPCSTGRQPNVFHGSQALAEARAAFLMPASDQRPARPLEGLAAQPDLSCAGTCRVRRLSSSTRRPIWTADLRTDAKTSCGGRFACAAAAPAAFRRLPGHRHGSEPRMVQRSPASISLTGNLNPLRSGAGESQRGDPGYRTRVTNKAGAVR